MKKMLIKQKISYSHRKGTSKMMKKMLLTFLAAVITASACVTSSAATVPDAYDLRKENQMTSARNQSPFGTCWAFAGMAAAESALLKENIFQTPDTLDLSEEALLWWACGDSLDNGFGWQKKSKEDGGYSNMVCGFLTSNGVYLEKDIPYQTIYEDLFDSYYIPEKRPDALNSLTPLYRASDIVYVDTQSREAVKKAIQNCGAVATVWYDDGNYRTDIPAYWRSTENSNNHAVALIGWDDNYPKENFLESNGQKPKNNGAWLVKNSYGSDFGDHGYMWISYEDQALFATDDSSASEPFEIPAYAVQHMEPVTKDTYIFQHDEYGAVSNLDVTGALCANVYDFSEGKPYLNQVVFETRNGQGQTYSLYYAPLSADGTPVTDPRKMTLLKTGVVSHNGYNTVSLDKSYVLPKEKGALVIGFSGQASIGVETTLLYGSRGLFLPRCNEQESYLIQNSQAQDMYTDKVNFTLKAVTSDTPVPSETFSADVNRDGVTDINDATEIQLYLVGSVLLDAEQKEIADIDKDGVIDILDVTCLQLELLKI